MIKVRVVINSKDLRETDFDAVPQVGDTIIVMPEDQWLIVESRLWRPDGGCSLFMRK